MVVPVEEGPGLVATLGLWNILVPVPATPPTPLTGLWLGLAIDMDREAAGLVIR